MLGQMLMRVLARAEGFSVCGTARPDAPGLNRFAAENGVVALSRLVREEGPFDLVINAIGVRSDRIDESDFRSVQRAIVANALLPHHLAAVAEEAAVRVIQVSTDGVFARDAGACFEDAPCAPLDLYGKTKCLGEPRSARVLTVRCSLIGPDPRGGRGLLEWLRSRPARAEVTGYTDQMWNGVTTLQFGALCRVLAGIEVFDAARAEAAVHHVCPNQTVSKLDLLGLLAEAYRPDISVRPGHSPSAANRTLATRFATLGAILGHHKPMRDAISELAVEETSSIRAD